MKYEIKALTPQLAKDFFDFFDNRAFTDNSPMQPCYCCTLNMTNEQVQKEIFCHVEENGGGIEGVKLSLRNFAEKVIQNGSLKGYLVFVDGISIGWCNANDKKYYSQIPEFEEENNLGLTKSVMCFEIAPEYRGKGIATALLERVIKDAKADGYIAVEGYPQLKEEIDTFDYFGPVRLFEKCGFTKIAQLDNTLLMRKIL